MNQRHLQEEKHFLKRVDTTVAHELDTNQCNPNLNYRMIVEMLSPPYPCHGKCPTAEVIKFDLSS